MFYKNLPYIGNILAAISSDRVQYLVFIGLSFVILIFTGVLYYSDNQIFQRFIGKINPILAILLAIILGIILFSILLSQKWFAIFGKETLDGVIRASVLAAVFGVIIILVDMKIVFPADTNILFPESILFYPAIGFFVEILFHLLPVTVLLLLLNSILKNANIFWISFLIVALLEPVYQALDMANSSRYPLWAVLYVGLHIYLFNLFQLLIFKKYDFISMYSFRLVYYLFWHIGWGYIRLRLLF